MHIREGMIPTILGTAVAATGIALKNTNLPENYRNGIIGFGLAHIMLGSVEMISDNAQNSKIMRKVTDSMNFR